jgi:hypothetical protein
MKKIFIVLFSTTILLSSFILSPLYKDGVEDKGNIMTDFEWEIVDIIPLEALLEVATEKNEQRDLLELLDLEDFVGFPARA